MKKTVLEEINARLEQAGTVEKLITSVYEDRDFVALLVGYVIGLNEEKTEKENVID